MPNHETVPISSIERLLFARGTAELSNAVKRSDFKYKFMISSYDEIELLARSYPQRVDCREPNDS